MIPTDRPNPILLGQLHKLCKAFGKRGAPEARVKVPGTAETQVLALSDDMAALVWECRRVLSQFGREL